MKKIIIITIVCLGTTTGILSSQTVKQVTKPSITATIPSFAPTGFRKDLGQAD